MYWEVFYQRHSVSLTAYACARLLKFHQRNCILRICFVTSGETTSAPISVRVNLVLKLFRNEQPVEAVSLVVPFILPGLKNMDSYVYLIEKMLTARMERPEWSKLVPSDGLFATAHEAFARVIGHICGQKGVFIPGSQKCSFRVREAVAGVNRALQVVFEGKHLNSSLLGKFLTIRSLQHRHFILKYWIFQALMLTMNLRDQLHNVIGWISPTTMHIHCVRITHIGIEVFSLNQIFTWYTCV